MTIEEVRQLFTENNNKSRLDIDLINAECITSKNNSFTLDDQGNLTVNSITANSGNISNMNNQSIGFDQIYPVGSVYISVSSINPSSLFGGTWESFGIGRTLVGVDTSQTEFNTVQKTGGEKKHTLTTGELPNHAHIMALRYIYCQAGNSDFWAVPYVPESSMGNAYTKSAGGNESHNNLQPYITVYMWKRTA